MRAARRNLYAKERPCGAGPSVRALDWLTLRLSPQPHGVGEPSNIRDLLGVRSPSPPWARLRRYFFNFVSPLRAGKSKRTHTLLKPSFAAPAATTILP